MGKLGGGYECEISDDCWMQMVSQPEGTNFHRAESGDGYIAVHSDGNATFIPFQATAISLSDRVHPEETNACDSDWCHIGVITEAMGHFMRPPDPDETDED